MATITPTITYSANYVTVTWTPMLNGDVGLPFFSEDHADRSVQVFGTFGVGGSATIQGTNEATPVNYATLDDSTGTAIAITTAKIKSIVEPTLFQRAAVTAGDGTTSLSVILYARRMRQR